jgi:hypothetical protein
MSGTRREGTLSKGPTLSSKSVVGNHHRAIRRHAHEHGGLLGFHDALAQARFMIREMKRQGPIARESAAALARCVRVVRTEVRRARNAHGPKSAELARLSALLYDAIALGFTLAYLLGDRADDRRPDRRKKATRARYYKVKKTAENRTQMMFDLGFKSMQGLRDFEDEKGIERPHSN